VASPIGKHSMASILIVANTNYARPEASAVLRLYRGTRRRLELARQTHAHFAAE
jgi:hypothetical protein